MITYKKSRITALLLVLVLMMSLMPAVYAAADVTPKLEISNSKGAYMAPGDTVTFTVKATNDGDDVWNSVKVTSTMTFIDMIAGSLRVDGATSSYTFTTAGKLTVNLGTIAPGASKTITFDATINNNMASAVSYSFSASGYNTNGSQRFTAKAENLFRYERTSAVPVINTIEEGDPQVTGTGVAGAVVTVTLPDGSIHNVPVLPGGTWTLNVPSGTTLMKDQIVRAYQTETGKLQSATVQTTVIANSTHNGVATKTSANLTTSGNVANIGDVIEYTITAKNDSTPSSQWSCVVTDTISDYVDFVANSVRVNNSSYPYTYDAVSRVLTVDLGNIAGGQTKTLTFQVRINASANGKDIENTADVGGVPTTDPDPKPVIEKSAPPTIDPVKETDDKVTGTGVPGADITVTLPDGTTKDTKVDNNNNWTVDVPQGLLKPGDEITAVQKEPDKDPSDEVSTNVLADTNPIKSLTKTSQNLTTTTGNVANVGDIIEYTVTAKNSGTASSTWTNCVVTDTLPAGVTFVAGSVRINNVPATAAQYTYVGGLLTVNLGDIIGGTQRVITFRVTINSDAHDLTIANTAYADGGAIDVTDPDPIEVIKKSAPPTINGVIETDTTVTGTGVPGATITVTFPGGTTGTATVNPGGTWTVNVPNSVVLHPNDVIYATQKELTKDISDQVSTIVQPNPDPVPSMTKTSRNLTTTAGPVTYIGDTIEYTITAKNDGAASSVWSCVVTDELHVGLTFVAGSVRINNVAATALQYSYNSATHVLTVNLGNIVGSQTKVITFQCRINTNAYGANIANTASADDGKGGDIVVTDPDPIDVIDKSAPPTIDDVLETDETVTGTGEPGATIDVTFPDGSTETTVVDPNGNWEVDVPDNLTLKPGDEITAVQTEDDKDPSDEEKTIVKGDDTVAPECSTIWRNSSGGYTAKAGDTLDYYAQVWNAGTPFSVWKSAFAVVTLDNNLNYVADSVTINGMPVNASRYNYNSADHTLTVYLGNIIGGGIVNFGFRTTVKTNVPDTITYFNVLLDLFTDDNTP